MAADTHDPVDGHPIFLDGGGVDIGVDPTQAAAYAAEVGHVISGDTAYRNAYPYARKGLFCSNTQTGTLDYHNGEGWVTKLSDAGIIALTLANNWIAFGSPAASPAARLVNQVVYFQGSIKDGIVENTESRYAFQIPVSMRPSGRRSFTYATNALGAGRIDVYPSGNVVVATGANQFVPLDAIHYPL